MEVNMEYVASLSYGKDSIIIPELCKIHGLPLDRIVHVEIMATDTISADIPTMVNFKSEADKIIKKRYGIIVEHLHSPKSYEECFYTKRGKKAKAENVGKIYGFPTRPAPWCNSSLKRSCLKKLDRPGIIQYIGIASDEPKRFHNLNDRKRSPLVEFNITEAKAREMAEELGLLSPIYSHSERGGCWFCHNQRLSCLRHLRKNYPEYWSLMLKWDKDSPYKFRSDGSSVHDLDNRFNREEQQCSLQ